VIVVDRLIYGIGVDLAGAVAVERSRDVAEQLGQLRLVVGAHTFPCGAPFGLGAHDRDGTVFEPDRLRARVTNRHRRRYADQPGATYRVIYG